MRGTDTPTILIAANDVEGIREVQGSLGEGTYTVVSVRTSRDLIRTLRRRTVDVAIVDTSLEDVEGHKLIPVIHEIDPTVEVIVTTRSTSPDLEEEVRRRQVLYYAIRPDDVPFIGDVVRRALGTRRSAVSGRGV